MTDLFERAGKYGQVKTFSQSRNNFEFDIKEKYPGHEGQHYDGFQFKGEYITLREAGNILAGMNAAQFDMDYDAFQREAGAYHQAGVRGLAMSSIGITQGEPPMYGEIAYQYLRSLYGYNIIKYQKPTSD